MQSQQSKSPLWDIQCTYATFYAKEKRNKSTVLFKTLQTFQLSPRDLEIYGSVVTRLYRRRHKSSSTFRITQKPSLQKAAAK